MLVTLVFLKSLFVLNLRRDGCFGLKKDEWTAWQSKDDEERKSVSLRTLA